MYFFFKKKKRVRSLSGSQPATKRVKNKQTSKINQYEQLEMTSHRFSLCRKKGCEAKQTPALFSVRGSRLKDFFKSSMCVCLHVLCVCACMYVCTY